MMWLARRAALLAPATVSPAPHMDWLRLVHVRPDSVTQVTRPYAIADTEDRQMSASALQERNNKENAIPVRCLVARRAFVRGAQIARIPATYVLTAQRAAQVMETVCRYAQQSPEDAAPLRSFQDFLHILAQAGRSTTVTASSAQVRPAPPYLLASRDGLLLTAVLYVLRCPQHKALVQAVCRAHKEIGALHTWLHSLPPRTPPFGLLLRTHYALEEAAEDSTINSTTSGSSAGNANAGTRLTRRPRRSLLTGGEDSEGDGDGMSVSQQAALHQQFLLDALHADAEEDNNNNNNNSGDRTDTQGASAHVPPAATDKAGVSGNDAKGDSVVHTTDNALATTHHKTYSVGEALEVVPSRELLTNFYRGTQTALTRRQQSSQVHRQGSGGGGSIARAALDQLASLQREVERHVVRPLSDALYTRGTNASQISSSSAIEKTGSEKCSTIDEDEDVVREEQRQWLHWAHFMLRSRVVNLHWRRRCGGEEGGVGLALVPFLDMCNHSGEGANITYHVESAEEKEAAGDEMMMVVVNATRAIAANEELVMHYGQLAQRGSIFSGFALPEVKPSTETSEERGREGGEDAVRANVTRSEAYTRREPTRYSTGDTPAARRNAGLAREMRAIERAQRYEMQSGEKEDGSESHSTAIEIVSPSLRADRHNGSGTSRGGEEDRHLTAHTLAQREAVAETRWFWRYGFYRDRAEVLREASTRWAATLRGRVAQLTDVRRRGRRGEFVLGVPENLAHLRLQRERLERERYHNTRIFPPQQS